ncbi:radical SAM protein [Desulfoplanes formicivorans]|uniref:Radical SAM protein n=1 Tax=Desulfoplanes formicivorans TaxID=1592317 RepID=A0A194AES0_9BACT|nr:radical SAM protein [Desulfoplanes formicivorans]
MALVFPEKEKFALSTLGWQVVYRILAGSADFAVERFYADDKTSPPVSADSGRELSAFPLICFSLNFEGDFVTVLSLLKRANIPLDAAQRQDWPLVMAGGPIAFLNPFPLFPALDFVFVGEAEYGFASLAHAIKDHWIDRSSRHKALASLARRPGILSHLHTDRVVRRVFVRDSDRLLPVPAASCFVSSHSEFRDMLLLEINRGCPYGCRFCAAGNIYRPPRQSRLGDLKSIVRQTSPCKVGLVGTALTDWPDLFPFLQWLHERNIKFSLGSLRADGATRDFLTFLRKTGTRSLTFALEGASQRLRQSMNKNLNEDALLEAVALASELQFNTLKLYLIVGWPGETEDDFDELDGFLDRIQQARKTGQGKKSKGIDLIQVSASCLVPKPWTPLQWAAMDSEAGLKAKMKRLKAIIKSKRGMRFSGENPRQARIQGLLARGDEGLFELLCLVEERGGWKEGLRAWGKDVAWHVDRTRDPDEIFPWDRLDIGVDKAYLWKEWQRFHQGMQTAPCPASGCERCGRCGLDVKILGGG